MNVSLAGLAFAASVAAVPSGGVPAGPERAAEGAVVVLATSATERGTGAGTIVAIAGDTVRVLTAGHVAAFGALEIRFPDDERVSAHIASSLPGHDLAIIEAVVTPGLAAELHAAGVSTAAPGEPVHIWGSGFDGPAFEPARVAATARDLPDGPARGRYEVMCDLCHRGDSGAGIFDARGALVGVYVGYFTFDSGDRIGVAEAPESAWKIARARTGHAPAIDRKVASTNANDATETALTGTDATPPVSRTAQR